MVSLFVSLSLPQLISPPNGENKTFLTKSTKKRLKCVCMLFNSHNTTAARLITCIAYLADIEGVMVEALDKERYGRWWELVIVSQQQ